MLAIYISSIQSFHQMTAVKVRVLVVNVLHSRSLDRCFDSWTRCCVVFLEQSYSSSVTCIRVNLRRTGVPFRVDVVISVTYTPWNPGNLVLKTSIRKISRLGKDNLKIFALYIHNLWRLKHGDPKKCIF